MKNSVILLQHNMAPGTFIMVDGMDGSGKSTVVEGWKSYLTQRGNTIFDLKEYWKKFGSYPEYSELKNYDFIFSCEPTYTAIGKTIREELIKNGTAYPPLAVAEAYSLDRLILYTKIIIPVLSEGKCVIQDRGVSTSLCYQPLTGGLDTAAVAHLPGNQLALEQRPDHLVIVSVSPETSLKRLSVRNEKQDNVIFENADFQSRVGARYASPEYRKLFTDRGTQVHDLSGEQEIGIMNERALDLLKTLVPNL